MRLRVVAFTCALLSQSLGLIFGAAPAMADSGGLELSELLINPAPPLTDEHDEYIEFHNASGASVNLKDFGILIGTTAPKHYNLPDLTVAPGGYATVAASDATATWALSNSGGAVTLQGAGAVALDATTWPDANSKSGFGWMKSSGGTWAWTTTPTPGAANQLTLTAPAPSAAPGQGSAGGATAPVAGGIYAAVELNELFPDPASPLTDAADEFMEVYNPNSAPVDLAGYVVKTGASLSTKHTLASVVVPPAGYVALKSATTKITLANDGSSVALFDPAGVQLGATITYPKAPTGSAWARSDETWSWTTSPTPGSANVLTAPAVTPAASAAKASSKTTTGAKAKAASTTKAKATKAAATGTSAPSPLVAAATTSGGHWLLFALAGLTIAYIVYEFRYDVRNLYFRLRGHPGSGKALGKIAQRWGSGRTNERPRGRQDNLRSRLGAGPGV